MPIFRIAGGIGLFAHVPKCAGSSIEDYLVERFGPIAFVDREFREQPARERWTKSSPQHLPVRVLERLFPKDFFLCRFAVVRHPASRLFSAFQVQRDVIGRLPRDLSFDAWLDQLPELQAAHPWYLDNHTRPMCDLVPAGVRVFHLENGLDALIEWLDAQAGDTNGPRRIGRTNTRAEAFAERAIEPPSPELTDRARDRVAVLYAADFDRFGYDPYRETY